MSLNVPPLCYGSLFLLVIYNRVSLPRKQSNFALIYTKINAHYGIMIMFFFLMYLFVDLFCIAAILSIHIQPGWDLSVRVMWMAVMKYLAMKGWIVSMFRPQARVQCVDPAQ